MRTARAILLLILLTLVHAQAPAPAPARALPLNRFPVSRQVQTDSQGYFRMAFAIGDDYFDGKDSRSRVRRHLQIAREVGVDYLRCAFSWNGIEPERGKYNFAFWDMLVDEAQKAGVQIIPYVAYTPEWAALSPDNFWQQPPRDPEQFRELMNVLASRYRGKIKSWELWNEPDLKEYWQGNVAEFAQLVKAGAEGVRQGDPDAVIVLGGMSRGPGDFFTALMNDYQIYRWVDVIALHGYPESWDEERVEDVYGRRIPKMETYATHNRTTLDLWVNEMGYADYRYQPAHASTWGTDIYYRYEHTPRYAADFLFKSFALTLATNDVSVAGWYRIDDFKHTDPRMPADKVHYHLGLMDIHGKPKPTFYAMKFAARLLQHSIRVAHAKVTEKPASQAVVHVFKRKDGKVIVTGWLRSSEYKELKRHTGMETDRRREHVNVRLPCSPAEVTTYTATGKPLQIFKPRSAMLNDVLLTGRRAYIAEVTCAR